MVTLPPFSPPPLPHPITPMCVPDSIVLLNNNEELDFRTSYNLIFRDANIVEDPYANLNVVSNYYDMYNISSDPCLLNTPIFLSVNIQSLNSKYEELRLQILELCKKNITTDAIALQEIWEIICPDSLAIPGYQFVYKARQGMRGGGVGFYIRNGLNFKTVENLLPFKNKILEALTVQISYPGKAKPVLLSSVYRSNGLLPNITQNQQMERFMVKFDELLHNLNNMRQSAYIFIDSNIDLLNLHANDSLNFLNSVILNGFLQCTMKATRFQNNSRTLIDQILTSGYGPNILTGTVISDISDHFFTLICPNLEENKNVEKTAISRSFSQANLNHFKAELGGSDWSAVTNVINVDDAFNEFWSIYTDLYELSFPKIKTRFNKNVHKQCPFMTNGLLISRQTKNSLLKAKVSVVSLLHSSFYRKRLPQQQRDRRIGERETSTH
jgi:hypothetical protein